MVNSKVLISVWKGRHMMYEINNIHSMQETHISSGIHCSYISGVERQEKFDELYRSVFHILEYDDVPITMRIINGAQFYSDIMRFERSFTCNHRTKFKPHYFI